jgi:hypothetical protein
VHRNALKERDEERARRLLMEHLVRIRHKLPGYQAGPAPDAIEQSADACPAIVNTSSSATEEQ